MDSGCGGISLTFRVLTGSEYAALLFLRPVALFRLAIPQEGSQHRAVCLLWDGETNGEATPRE